jgi:hypothetical protein
MESYPSSSFPKTLNLFEHEETSLENLKNLLNTPVGYNSAKDIDPWHHSLLEIKNGK